MTKKFQTIVLLTILLDQLSKLAAISFQLPVFSNRGIAFGLIIGGGVSNLLDRIFRGAVVDFIRIGPLPVFNLADVAICLGVAMIIVGVIRSRG